MGSLIWPAFNEVHHWTTNLVVQLDGGRAVVECDVDCKGTTAADGVMQVISATYRDVFERRHGQWGIAHRVVDIHYFIAVAGVELAPSTG